MKKLRFLCALMLSLLAACSSDPKAASRRYVANGNQYLARGQYREASILYRRALTKDLRSPDAWYSLGLVNARLGELPEARKDFSRAMELDPGNLDAVVQLGDLDLAFYLLDPPSGRGFLADLKEITGRLLKKDPRSFDGLRFSGSIALAQNDTTAAILKFQQANLVKPDQPDLTLTLVQTLFAARRDGEAESLASSALDRQKTFAPLYDALYMHYMRGNRPQLAEQVLRRQMANNPKLGAGLIQLAFHYFVMHSAVDVQSTIERLTSDPKAFPDGRLQAGDFYVRVRDYAAALSQYEAGERQQPKQNSAAARVYRRKMAEVLATQGEHDRAEKMVAGLLHDDSRDPEALALEAALSLASGDRGKAKAAIGELQPLIAKMPRNAALHFNLGRAYVALADGQSLERAREQFEAALRLDPHHAPAKLAWAELALARGAAAQAAQATAEILSEDPTNPAARLLRARALAGMAEPEKARTELSALLQMYPTSNDGREQLAELDFAQHRYQDAEAGFRALLQANDNRGAGGLLKTLIVQGQLEPAVQFASEQVKQQPGRADTRLVLAGTLIAAGQYSAAAVQFQTLINQLAAHDPKLSELYLQLGEAKLRGADLPGSLAAFETAKQLAPADPRPVFDLGLLYDRTGRSEQARKEYEIVIQLEPENATALNNLAYLEAEEGVDLDQALAHAQHAQQKLPGDLDVQDTVALVYIRKNLTNDGIRMLRDLVSRRPDSAPFHLHLALALYQKGDRPLAKRELETALRHQPSAKEESKIRELLAKVG
ncbi:MAG TPA: tetratricopeptide repeat protein [Bryobacteraceae bacterium]|nr:tetratricopeptide repeat protein [Bryobacteraceae bacterium]